MLHRLSALKTKANRLYWAAMLTVYISCGGATPAPKVVVKPLYRISCMSMNLFGRLAKLCRVLAVMRLLLLVAFKIPFGPLISLTAFTWKVSHAALTVEMKHHKLA